MVKKIAEQQSEQSADQSAGFQSEASKALQEIDSAAELASQSLQLDSVSSAPLTQASAQVAEQITAGGTLGADGVVSVDDRQPETAGAREERIQMFIKRATAQKKKGRELLSKDYVGALSVEMGVKINDVNIAASAERFVGICDLFLYTLGKQGPSVLGGDETETLLDSFTEMVTDYSKEATDSLALAQASLDHESSVSLDGWITPKHKTAAFEMTINAKHRQTARILNAMQIWDRLVLAQSVLEWNGKLDSSMVAQSRQLERRKISKIHAFAARSLVGLKRRTDRVPAKRANTESFTAPAAELATA